MALKRDEMDGAKVFIDAVVLAKVDQTAPSYMTRTAWVNHLLDRAVASLGQAPYAYATDDS